MMRISWFTYLAVILVLAFYAAPSTVQGQATEWRDGSFTDSSGRMLLYRYWFRSNWDLMASRGAAIYFHGNNHGTAEELREIEWPIVDTALDLGLAVVVPASPNSIPEDLSWGERTLIPESVGRGGTRFWSPDDARLIHELIQSNLQSQLVIDKDRVIFAGGSQGTCFLAEFVEFYGGNYGGGFHAHCGCFWLDFDGDESHDTWTIHPPFHKSPWRPTFQWTPFATSTVSDRFKVFVEATTEDFLYPAAVSMAQYYSEWLGLKTRTDLDRSGGHCNDGATPKKEIYEWLTSGTVPGRPGDANDTDGDGTPNQFDLDDDGDGAPDFIDASPLNALDWRDTDGDSNPDATDEDADGDGVRNEDDAFPLNAKEWYDTDGDGIGDRLDNDDDNGNSLSFVSLGNAVGGYNGINTVSSTQVHSMRPDAVVYPVPEGETQSYQFLELGNTSDVRFEIMVDSFIRPEPCPTVLLSRLCDVKQFSASGYYSSYYQNQFFRIWIDRNRNRDLTDDGPPLLSAVNTDDWWPGSTTEAILEVLYASGQVLPYAIVVSPGRETHNLGLSYSGASVWRGEMETPLGERMLAITVDGNLDGLFDSRDDAINNEFQRDFVCLDLDRDGWLNECDFSEDAHRNRVRSGAIFPSDTLDWNGGQYVVSVAPTGREVTMIKVDPTDLSTEKEELTVSAKLYPNYPNPFNSSTVIEFELSELDHVQLQVFDLTGKVITELVDGVRLNGRHKVTFNAAALPTGVYMYRLRANGRSIARTMILMR